MSAEFDLSNIEDYEIIDEIFDLNSSMLMAQEILEDLRANNVLLKGEFEDDVWVFLNENQYTRIYVSFEEIDTYIFINNYFNSTDCKLMVKCWFAENLTYQIPASVRTLFSYLLATLKLTSGFVKEHSERLQEELLKLNVTDKTKYIFIKAILSFLSYVDAEEEEHYNKKLLPVLRNLNLENEVRSLPSSKQALKFSSYLERYFKEISENGENIYNDYFFPIYAWWKLTNIIPMRPSEFCLMDRDCLHPSDNNYYIKLPRKKVKTKLKKRAGKSVVTDTIALTKEMYNFLNGYKLATSNYDNTTTTFISYEHLAEMKKKQKSGKFGGYYRKIFKNVFTNSNLSKLIELFYDEILYGQYQVYFKKADRVRPNDTRHFAFISLMMQGVSPIEIARLGGHSTIQAQYHYVNHVEYFIDSQIDTLMRSFEKSFSEDEQEAQSLIEFEDIKKRIWSGPFSDFRSPLKIGYCTDENMACEASEHVLCSKWWIEPEELVAKEVQFMILNIIKSKRDKVVELAAFLINLHKETLVEDISEFNPKIMQSLKTTSNEIHDLLFQIAKYKSAVLLER